MFTMISTPVVLVGAWLAYSNMQTEKAKKKLFKQKVESKLDIKIEDTVENLEGDEDGP